MNYFDQINSHEYIYLGGIEEGLNNTLRIVIRETGVNLEAQAASVGDLTLSAQGIESTVDSHAYEIYFDSYIGYSVIDESYAAPSDSEIFAGKIYCIYEKSAYLDYLFNASCACEDYPGRFKHYGFNCLNHVIDIASTDEPTIKMLS